MLIYVPPLNPLFLDMWILFALWCVSIVMGVFAFINAIPQRADAFSAVDTMSKGAWLGLTGGATVAMLLFNPNGPGLIFWLAGVVVISIYLVDIRHRLSDVQRGPYS